LFPEAVAAGEDLDPKKSILRKVRACSGAWVPYRLSETVNGADAGQAQFVVALLTANAITGERRKG
jgi:hypothetical protein